MTKDDIAETAYAAGVGTLFAVGINVTEAATDAVLTGGPVTHVIAGIGMACFVYGRSNKNRIVTSSQFLNIRKTTSDG